MTTVAAADSRPLHIVHCFSALTLGGSELATVELAEGQLAAGHKVTLIAKAGPLSQRAQRAGAQCLDWSIGKKRLSTLAYIRRLRRWLLANAVDVVHAQARLPAWIAYAAIRPLSPAQRPVWCTTVHGQYSLGRYSRVMASGDGVIAVSQAMAHWARRLHPQLDGPVQVIYGGVDPQHFFPAFRADDTWLTDFDQQWPGLRQQPLLALVARGTRLKNHAGFIELIAQLRAQGEDVAGLIVGGFSKRRAHYREELEQLAQRHQVTKHIHYLGDRQDVRELMSIASMVVNISNKAEAFGRTLAEAVALGRPILSWDRGGASEILQQCFPQGAVPADDSSRLLATAQQILHHPTVPASVPYQLALTTSQTLAFYQMLLSHSTSRS